MAEPKDKPAPKAAQSSDEPTFSKERAIQVGEQLVGHPAHVVAGALHGSRSDNLTVKQIEDACEKFLKKSVK